MAGNEAVEREAVVKEAVGRATAKGAAETEAAARAVAATGAAATEAAKEATCHGLTRTPVNGVHRVNPSIRRHASRLSRAIGVTRVPSSNTVPSSGEPFAIWYEQWVDDSCR